MTTEIILSIATFLAIMAAAWFIIVFVITRFKKEADAVADTDKTGAKGGITEKVKKTLAERPSWLVTFAAVGGGWLFLLFSVYVLLSPVWQWLAAHQKLLWMTPIAIFAAQVLRASKKKPAEYMAYAIILVLFIAFAQAIPWGGENANARRTAEQARLATETQWQNCIAIPANPALQTSKTILSAPAGNKSPCYLIREGYIGRISPLSPRAHVRLFFWRNERIVDMSEETTNVLQGINSTRDIAFVAMSLVEKPATIGVWLEKR